MDIVPLWLQITVLCILLFLSSFFAMTETALIAANKHRLRHLAKRGSTMAQTALWLLERTDQVLSLILIANTLVNALITSLVTLMAITAFGQHQNVLTLTTAAVAFVLVVLGEITPKVVGATYPEKIALPASLLLKPLMALARPIIWFVNLFVSALLKVLRIKTGVEAPAHRLSAEELHSIVLEGGNFMPQKHKSIVMNLFDLEKMSLEDIMVPRAQIEGLDLSMSVDDIRHQLTTCYHNKLPVYENDINQMVGVLHVRKALSWLTQKEEEETSELRMAEFRHLLSPPYFVLQDTDVFTQLQYFQENAERMGIVVDEYGEVQGLVTLENIIEEMVGEFTTSKPGMALMDHFSWNDQGECQLEGSASLRDINKCLGLHFSLEGAKTLNGVILDSLQDIPENPVCIKMADCVIEIIQVHNQAIKVAKLIKMLREQ